MRKIGTALTSKTNNSCDCPFAIVERQETLTEEAMEWIQKELDELDKLDN